MNATLETSHNLKPADLRAFVSLCRETNLPISQWILEAARDSAASYEALRYQALSQENKA